MASLRTHHPSHHIAEHALHMTTADQAPDSGYNESTMGTSHAWENPKICRPHTARVTGMTLIGFDLDMTLIDSRPGFRPLYERLRAESGFHIDVDLVLSRLGAPIEVELANWVPANEVDRWSDRYRELYPEIALPLITTLPGAHAALSAARVRGGAIIITAKHGPNAQLHVDRLGLEADAVFGRVWRDAKAAVLTDQGAVAYVGDHVHDMQAATSAGVVGIGVTTGPFDEPELRRAGASVVMASLEDFPEWLAQQEM